MMNNHGVLITGVDLNCLAIGKGDGEQITGAERKGREGAEIRGGHGRGSKGAEGGR